MISAVTVTDSSLDEGLIKCETEDDINAVTRFPHRRTHRALCSLATWQNNKSVRPGFNQRLISGETSVGDDRGKQGVDSSVHCSFLWTH